MNRSIFRQWMSFIVTIFFVLLVLVKFDSFFLILQRIFYLLTPFWISIILYYILNDPVKYFSSLFARLSFVKRKEKAIVPAVFISYLIFFGLFILLAFLIIPRFQESLLDFFNNLEHYINGFNQWLDGLTENLRERKMDPALIDSMQQKLVKFGASLTERGILFARGLIGNLVSIVGNLLIAVILSIYLLAGDLTIRRYLRKFINALSGRRQEMVRHVASLMDQIFDQYFYVQLTEGLILGFLCLIVFLIFQIPYAQILAAIISLMGMVPVVGGWAAALLGSFLILLVQPKKLLLFLILYLVTQQIESNVIYPRRVNIGVGLPPIIVILSVLVGAGLGGIVGAFISVPFASLIYHLLREWVAKRQDVQLE